MKVVIVGAGKLGLKVANTLLGGDHDVTIIDTNEDILQKISSPMRKRSKSLNVSISHLMTL